MEKKKIIFIEWSKYNTRGASLSSKINAKVFFIGEANVHTSPFLSLLTYLPKSFENLKILWREKPDVLIITNTTWVIALVNFVYTKLFGIKLILDSHSCAFDNSLLKYPLFLSKFFARFSFLSFVTNEAHKVLLNESGAESLVINDIPYEEILLTDEKKKLSDKFNICYVCTFAEDEPYMEVLKAGEQLDNVHIFMTGKYSKQGLNPDDYSNTTFLGFATNEDYRLYINNVDAIMTLTTRADTMQRAGSEAVSVKKPLITSDTKMLRRTFYKGAVFVGNTSYDISEGISQMIDSVDTMKIEIEILQQERNNKFLTKLETIKEKLEI